MARDNFYFLLSGFISLSLFSIFLSLFFYMMFASDKINIYALSKDNFISISLEIIPVPTKTIEKEVVIQNKEVQSIEEVKEVDIGDLFSEVWTKKIKLKKKEKKIEKKIDKKRLELIQKKIKTKEINSVKKASQNELSSQSEITNSENKKSSSGDEVNEYLAKIQAIVYKYFYPPKNSQGYTVKAVIVLSAIGKVQDFRILSYSINQALNQECDKIKGRLVGVLFPLNPQNKSSSTIVNITSDKN